MSPKRPERERSLVFTDKAAKSLKVAKVSHPKGYEKILDAINALMEHDFPPLYEVKKMKWEIDGNPVHAMRIKCHPEYRVVFQIYPEKDQIKVEDVVTREKFERLTRGF